MYLAEERIIKLRFSDVSCKRIARLMNKRSHTVKSWLYGKAYHERRN
jgi:hypothetical protein